jgi:hypothetical protein
MVTNKLTINNGNNSKQGCGRPHLYWMASLHLTTHFSIMLPTPNAHRGTRD